MARILPIVVVFAVGGLAGMLVAVSTMEPEEVVVYEPSPELSSEEPASEEKPEAKPVPATARGETWDDPVKSAIASVVAVEVGERSGSISGRVTTAQGEALGGVTIKATPGTRPDREEADSLEEKVRRYIRDEQWRDELRAEGSTDEEGNYVLPSIGEGNYRMTAEAPGYRLQAESGWRVKAGDTVDFLATPVAEITLTIRLADGSEPKEASVSVRRGNSSRSHTWKRDDRSIEVEPGLMTLEVTANETQKGRIEDVSAELGEGATELEVQLEARGGVKGRVIFSRGEVEKNAVVYLLPAAMKADPTPDDLMGAPHTTWVHGSRGFNLTDLEPGTYWIGAARGHGHEGNEPSMQQIVIGSEMLDIDVELPALELGDGVTVYAFGPDGAPLADARVVFELRTSEYTNSGYGTSTRLQDGGIFLAHDENMRNQLSQMSGFRTYVTASHGSYGSESVEVADSTSGMIEITFREPGRAIVRVPGYKGSDLFGRVLVQLQPSTTTGNAGMVYYGGYRQNDRTPDENEEVRVGPLSPGEYNLILQYSETRRGRWSTGELARQPVTVNPGENHFSIGIPPIYSLEVLFPADVAGGSVTIQAVDSSNQFGARHEQFKGNSVTIEALVAGEYTVRAWGSGIENGSMTVVVPSAPVVFDPPPVNAIRVHVSDPEGPLAQAGFENGDVIRKINGQTFEGEEQLAMLGVFFQGASEVTVTVGRGDQEVELTVNAKEMMSGDPGGRMEPTAE